MWGNCLYQFDFEDYLDSMEQMRKMGGLSSIMGMLPGMGNLGGKMPDLDSEEHGWSWKYYEHAAGPWRHGR